MSTDTPVIQVDFNHRHEGGAYLLNTKGSAKSMAEYDPNDLYVGRH